MDALRSRVWLHGLSDAWRHSTSLGCDGARKPEEVIEAVTLDDWVAEASAPAAIAAGAPRLPCDVSDGTRRFGYCLNQGPRRSMEDAIDAQDRLALCSVATELYAVYDGHGGTQAVDFVRRRLPFVISQHHAINDERCLCEVLEDAFVATDQELLSLLRQGPNREAPASAYTLSSGCVACVAVIRGKFIHVANLGDCRAVVCVGGEMRQLTNDHRVETNEAEHERLKRLGVDASSDGYVHGAIGVSRAFGDWSWSVGDKCPGLVCTPDRCQVEIGGSVEFLLLACDGIFEHMTCKEAGQIVRRALRAAGNENDAAKSAAKSLVRHAEKRGSSDNMSAVVVVFNRPVVESPERQAPRLFGRGKVTLEELAKPQL